MHLLKQIKNIFFYINIQSHPSALYKTVQWTFTKS